MRYRRDGQFVTTCAMSAALRLTVLTAIVATAAVPASALAAPPANDAYANATLVETLPFTTSEDLSEATEGEPADIAALNACGTAGFGVDRGVWFMFRPKRAQRVTLLTTGPAQRVGAG